MNCKPGDLAVIVADILCPENIGRFVVVVGPTDSWEMDERPYWEVEAVGGDLSFWWTHNGMLTGEKGRDRFIDIADGDLRPIRDNDGEDESFRWTPAPEKVTV